MKKSDADGVPTVTGRKKPKEWYGSVHVLRLERRGLAVVAYSGGSVDWMQCQFFVTHSVRLRPTNSVYSAGYILLWTVDFDHAKPV